MWGPRAALCGLTVLGLVLVTPACGSSGFTIEHHELWTDHEPPAPLIDIPELPPGPGYVWLMGHWYWNGGDWSWIEGRFERPPVESHVWVHGGWVRQGDRFLYIPGRWAHPRRKPAYVYVHPRQEPEPVLPDDPTVIPPSDTGKCAATSRKP